jgi:hypothetical protein
MGRGFLSLSALRLQMKVEATRILASFLVTQFCASCVAFSFSVDAFENPPKKIEESNSIAG